MKLFVKAAFIAIWSVSLIPIMAQASFIYSGSVTDQGVKFDLTVSTFSGSIHDLALIVDTTGYSGTAVALHGISLKPLNNLAVPADIVARGPHPLGIASWDLKAGQINANSTFPNGNSVGGGSGWFSELRNANGGLALGGGGDTFTFNWRIDFGSNTFVNPPGVKAIYVNGNGNKVNGLTSTNFMAGTPEPSTLLLFSVGIVGIIAMGYRQRKKAA